MKSGGGFGHSLLGQKRVGLEFFQRVFVLNRQVRDGGLLFFHERADEPGQFVALGLGLVVAGLELAAALVEGEDYTPIRPLVDWLAYNGFTVITKPAREFTDASGRRRVKGSMDVELAVDALQLAPRIDHAVLFSGDGDLRVLVEALAQGLRRA